MNLIADAHLHLYSCYNLDWAFSYLLHKLKAANMQAIFAGFLAERVGCNFYAQMQTGNLVLHDFRLEHADRSQLTLKRKSDGCQLTLLPGRQIVAAEGIEVLALCTDALFAEGIPAAELIKLIREQNGVPVLPWSPGKWFFQRGKVIDGLLRQFTGQDFLLGDVSLRPKGWSLPLLMRKARRFGYKIIYGSDPLPFSGEEEKFGMYGSHIISPEEELAPDEMLGALLAGKAEAASFGRRSTPLELFRRLRYNAAARRQQSAFSNT
ncbi:hypothetical protein [Candidatus Electronema sp. PJ]|uniref:hypothetical protein n=1 Tax=Candidatus Electronema sp. PJ TaxID=3401572 RepID=UPI003AA7CA01